MAGRTLRDYIEVIAATLNEAGRDTPWAFDAKALFMMSFAEMAQARPIIKTKLEEFKKAKLVDPLSQRFGGYDRPFTGPGLKGFQHCHLGPDVILIYTLSNRLINLVYVCSHTEIEGKRMKATAQRLAPYSPK